jgi:hypothetical protein
VSLSFEKVALVMALTLDWLVFMMGIVGMRQMVYWLVTLGDGEYPFAYVYSQNKSLIDILDCTLSISTLIFEHVEILNSH